MSASNEDFEQRVRERAYALWEAEGQPEGRAEEFWDRARRELEHEEGAVAPEPPAIDRAAE
jgi:hypothetical protein